MSDINKKGKMFVTFGQIHTHSVNGVTLDKNCVAVIECKSHIEGRNKIMDLTKGKFCTTYFEDQWSDNWLEYYPRGFIII